MYNTRAVVRRTGVPADTFRAWERRYGVPSPLRTAGNQRLYSERDIRIITWLREQTAVGLTISQAIHLMRSDKNPLPTAPMSISAPLDPEIEEVLTGKRSETHDLLTTQRRRIVDAFSRLDGQAAEHILQETYAWAELEVVLTELLHDAVSEIVHSPDYLPPQSPVSHFARAFVHRKFASLYNLSNPNDGRGPLLAASVAGESRDLTLLLSAIFLSRAGYRMVFLGPDLAFDALIGAMRIVRPIAVCLAAADENTVATLKDWIPKLADVSDGAGMEYGKIPICYTGRIFVEQPEIREQIKGHFLGPSGLNAVEAVEAALGVRR
jgi:DNA-binding transcriptional MerR regulator